MLILNDLARYYEKMIIKSIGIALLLIWLLFMFLRVVLCQNFVSLRKIG